MTLPLPLLTRMACSPNILVSGAAAWAEDNWGRVRIEVPHRGGRQQQVLEFDSIKPCSRYGVASGG